MKALYFLFLYSCFSLTASEASRADYIKLIDMHPEVRQTFGNAAQGEIEILVDPEKMAAIEAITGRDVGVFAQDSHWWVWLNEACRLPSGKETVMSRIVEKTLNPCPGVGVLPVLPNGKIMLNCEFRHSTRHFELEMPRGGVKSKESLEAAARREVLEETGLVVDQLIYLGQAAGDSGVTGMLLPIYMGQVNGIDKPEREEDEIIDQNVILSIQEAKEALLKGYIECKIAGVSRRVYARDPFLAYALILMEMKQLP